MTLKHGLFVLYNRFYFSYAYNRSQACYQPDKFSEYSVNVCIVSIYVPQNYSMCDLHSVNATFCNAYCFFYQIKYHSEFWIKIIKILYHNL